MGEEWVEEELDVKQSIWEIWYDVLFRPVDAIRYITRRKPVAGTFVTFLAGTMLPLLAMEIYGQEFLGTGLTGVLMALQIFGGALTWFLGTAVFHLIAEFTGGTGSALGLFSATGFTYLPRLFIVPLLMVLALLPETVRPVCLGSGTFLIWAWTLYLDMKSIQENYCLSARKAVLILLLPLLLAVLTAIFAVIIAAVALALYIGNQ
ncbi:Yip1 family protein [Acetonema longum]|uniref:Yip1 domain-containing protein n=1 Tax=Acetonema longum DSM 6540 TaxID=1009370 RepID=F7NH93_9FIRM|nr:Yip1 family protein [Acetonema longum]EGO64576.1 hypothetical protein ALO_07193 [Acetonema longum DSM 6540]